MKTKALILSAVAIAVGEIITQAQSNLYSANIVGYVNQTNGANQFVMLANPLDNGTNDLPSLLPSVSNGAQVFVLQGGTLQSSSKTKGVWSQNFIIPPGTGFFLNNPAAGTNTFVGSVAGFSNSIVCPAGISVLVGSPIPFSGSVNDTGPNTMNLGILPNGSSIYMLVNGSLQSSTKTKGIWSFGTLINAGQGFYINSPTDITIPQFLNIQ